MTDVVASADLVREAENAADDAAADARAEVLRRGGSAGAFESPPRSAMRQRLTARQSTASTEWHKFVVDIWLTNLNPTEFGVFKRARNRAKSRQFTADMDIYGEIIENGRRTGLLGYRKDLWEGNEDLDKRLVFKLFSDKLNWRATMDLMLARSVQQTIGARGLPVMTYSVNQASSDQVVYIERSANKWPLLPENFSFFLLDDDGGLEFFRIRQDVLRFGEDFTVLNGRNEVIGHLDGAVFSIAGKWRGKLRKDYADKRLLDVLKLFGGMIVFNRACRSHVRRVARRVLAGRHALKLEKQETDLYMNPRRVR